MNKSIPQFLKRGHLCLWYHWIELQILWSNYVVGFPVLRESLMHVLRGLFHVLPVLKNRPISWPIVTALYQRMEFGVERLYALRKRQRVKDPLVAYRLSFGQRNAFSSGEIAGVFNVALKFNGISINGYLHDSASSENRAVAIIVNGQTIRTITCSKWGGIPYFRINLKREVVMNFPTETRLSVQLVDGAVLAFRGRSAVDIDIPEASDTLVQLLDEGNKITKKGQLASSHEEVVHRQSGYLELYSRMKQFFDTEVGTPIFLMYGTLLGLYRDGDFIPGDDDFDAGYIVDTTDPVEAKEETKRIITKLLYAGYTVSFNRRGKLFRVHSRKNGRDGIHLDLRPVWFNDGNMWAHLQACIPASVDDFLPVQTVPMRGVQVDIPRDPEVLLAGYYGTGWKVPDPGYANDTAATRTDVVRTLDKARITPAEYKRMVSFLRHEGFREGMGKFISLSYQNMYPLDQFIN